jgi:hypothetical protein
MCEKNIPKIVANMKVHVFQSKKSLKCSYMVIFSLNVIYFWGQKKSYVDRQIYRSYIPHGYGLTKRGPRIIHQGIASVTYLPTQTLALWTTNASKIVSDAIKVLKKSK